MSLCVHCIFNSAFLIDSICIGIFLFSGVNEFSTQRYLNLKNPLQIILSSHLPLQATLPACSTNCGMPSELEQCGLSHKVAKFLLVMGMVPCPICPIQVMEVPSLDRLQGGRWDILLLLNSHQRTVTPGAAQGRITAMVVKVVSKGKFDVFRFYVTQFAAISMGL